MVVLFVFDRWDVADAAVQAAGVVPVDPEQGRQLELLDGAPGAFEVDALGLVQPDRRLGQSVDAPIVKELLFGGLRRS